MHRRHLRLALGVLIAAVSLVVAGAAGGAPKKANAGLLIFGAEQEPPCLNGFLEGCNNTWTSWTAGIALASPYIEKPNFTIVPYMAAKAAKVTRSPFTVTYTIRKNAKWSDGKPVTAADAIFTWHTIMNPQFDLAGRSGWDSIRSARALNSKTVKFIFSKPYAPWKVLLDTSLLPQHALQGANFNEVWNSNYNDPKTGASMASGPFKIQSYTKGQSIVMVRNSSFFGAKPKLDKITFVFRTNTDTEIQAIRGGEVDAIYPQPQLQLAALRGQSGLRVQSNAGTTLEHIDINTGAGNSNPLLGQKWFRQAIAYSLDRKGMVRQLFRTLNPGLPVLQNLSYTNQQRGLYVGHFQKYSRNLKKVASLFKAHGCAKGSDGIYSCHGTRASVRLGTTAGNKLRELAVEILQAQAKSAGIEFRPDSQPSSLFFPRISDNKYDLALFAWVGTGDPAGQVDIYGCVTKNAKGDVIQGGSNWKSYCNKTVTRLLKASDSELRPSVRRNDVNRADAIMANDVPTIPLYQKPTYFVFKTKARGLKDNPTLQGPTWLMRNESKGSFLAAEVGTFCNGTGTIDRSFTCERFE
jgi:peptide/nickel transport system substrate-binding protein